MKICIGLSLIFLVMYIAYHITSTSTIFGDINKDGIRDNIEKAEIGNKLYLYAFILISHFIINSFNPHGINKLCEGYSKTL